MNHAKITDKHSNYRKPWSETSNKCEFGGLLHFSINDTMVA